MTGKYTLPQLPYDYAALEPHVSARIMELHHGKHHASYVKNANDVLDQIGESRQKEDWSRLPALERALAFHLSGHILHSIFWGNLTPRGGGRPGESLARALERDLGGFDRFQAQMNQAAATIMGSGWAALVWEPTGGRLLVTQVYDHQSNLVQGGLPILVMDAWEHAFYLQYENRKTDFFAALWNVWNWEDIGRRYEAVARVRL
jgi:Fe-Mn family superoxide dismutase